MNPEKLKQELIEEAKLLQNYITETRRYLHMYPETAFEEYKTSKFLEKELIKIGYKTYKTAGTGVIAVINDNKKGKTVALRADIDALNVTELNTVSYKSKNPGKMHACGHDAHMSALLGAAKIIFIYKNLLPGKIKLIFQPGEEGSAGAKKIISEGHLDDVDAIFGLHVWTDIESGVVGLKDGVLFSSCDQFNIQIKGIGGHAAIPHKTIDPTAVTMDIYNALQKIISREINTFDSAVITTPQIETSKANNIIPDSVSISGTYRTINNDTRVYLKKRIKELVTGYSSAWRCESKITFLPDGYPPIINNKICINNLKTILNKLDKVQEIKPFMVSEDFSFYLNKTKGAFIILGCKNKNNNFPHHHPSFNIDESILWKAAAIYALAGFYFYYI